MNRREFLAASLAATAATSAVSAADDPVPVIDTHQHLWDLKRFKLAWVKDGDALARSYLPSDYARATEGLNVVKAVYMEVDVSPDQQQAEADWVVDLCKRGDTPTAAAVISGRPGSDGFKAYASQFKGKKYVKGIRRVLHGGETPGGHSLDPKFVADIRLLGELGLSFDLCMRSADLGDAVKLIDACPDTRFILDHCGNLAVGAAGKEREEWKRSMDQIGKRKNVVGKVSGIVASAKPGEWKPADLAPTIDHTLAAFGPDRVMFGGDWPVCTRAATFKQWLDALKVIVKDRKPDEQRKLFHDNAARFYGLDRG
jgi:predicted TIM-barrel fold metal-dependent hydrolase